MEVKRPANAPRPRGAAPLIFALTTALAMVSGAGCRPAAPEPPPLPEGLLPASATATAHVGGLRFREVAAASGLRYRWEIPGPRPLDILQTIGNGCAFLDYDGDGNLDILLVGGKPALFRGDGKGTFADVTAPAGLGELSGHFLGCAVGDYDRDGRPDLYLSGWREGRLLRNAGGTGFRDVSRAVGIGPQPFGTSAGFADLDGDGWLDLLVTNYLVYGPGVRPRLCPLGSPKGQIPTACGPQHYRPLFAVAYRNRGGSRFEDATKTWGFAKHGGRGLGVAFATDEGTGLPRVAFANDETPSDLFLPGAKATPYRNVGVEAGIARNYDGRTYAGMGLDWGDYDNDGRADLFVTAYSGEIKPLFRDEGDGVFTNVSASNNLSSVTARPLPFGCKFADFDNDGWLDLVIANGHVQSNQEDYATIDPGTYRQTVQLIRNRAGRFHDVSDACGVGAVPPVVGRGLATGDYDNDGRMDALVVDAEGAPLLLRNESEPAPWLGLRLRNRHGRDAYGAVVTVETGDGRKLRRECQTAGSYLSSSDPRVHVGLGATAKTARVTIRWPDGTRQTLTDLAPGRYHTLRQPEK